MGGEEAMRSTETWVFLGVALAIVALNGDAVAGTLCPNPRAGLELPNQQPAPYNVDGQTIAFSYRSQSYPVDLYSGFAPRGSSFCVRYEVENKGLNNIQKFYWPLATFEMDGLQQRQRQSIVMTKPPGKTPS